MLSAVPAVTSGQTLDPGPPPLLPNAHEDCAPSFAVNLTKSRDTSEEIHCTYQLFSFSVPFLAPNPCHRNSDRDATLPGMHSLQLNTWPGRHVVARCAFTVLPVFMFLSRVSCLRVFVPPRLRQVSHDLVQEHTAIVHMNPFVI